MIFLVWLSVLLLYIEARRWADWAIVAVVLFFLFNIWHSVSRRAGWNDITRMLVIGLGALAFFYLFGMKFFANVALDQYFWWWVIHLWVEGAWELIAAALYALLLIRLFDFPRGNEYDQRRGWWALWLMTSGMAVMTVALTVAGIVQIYLERMLGLPFAEVQSYLGIHYDARLVGGVLMILGIALFLADVFALRAARKPAEEPRLGTA